MSLESSSTLAKLSYKAMSCPVNMSMNSEHSMRDPNYKCDNSLDSNSRLLQKNERLVRLKQAEQHSQKEDGASHALSSNTQKLTSRLMSYRELLAERHSNRIYSQPVRHAPYKKSIRDLKRQMRVESLLESFKQLKTPASSTDLSKTLPMAKNSTPRKVTEKSTVGKKLSATKPSPLQELKEELDALREKENRRTNWLAPGIMVRIISRRLGKSNLLRLAEIREVKEKHTALLEIVKPNDSVSLIYADQDHLQTVVLDDPSFPRVMIVNGGYRGCTGVLIGQSNGIRGKANRAALNGIFPRISFIVKIDSGVYSGRVVEDVKADDVATLLNAGSK